MGWFEIANLLGSGIMGAVITLLSQKAKDKREERDFLIKKATLQKEDTREARDAKGGHESDANQNKYIEIERNYFGIKFHYKKTFIDKGLAVRSTGFHFTRRLIALIVMVSTLLLPKLLPIFSSDITIIIGYVETIRGFWPFFSDMESIKWVAFGDGNNPIVISPMEINLVYSITSLFFGNQLAKR